MRAVIPFTRPAGTARDSPRHHDAIAGPQMRDCCTHLLDDPGAFVTEQDRELIAPPIALPDKSVGVAHTTGHDTYDYFTGVGVVQVELTDHDWLTCREQYCRGRCAGTHALRSSSCVPTSFTAPRKGSPAHRIRPR
jgi:hypothetical protein